VPRHRGASTHTAYAAVGGSKGVGHVRGVRPGLQLGQVARVFRRSQAARPNRVNRHVRAAALLPATRPSTPAQPGIEAGHRAQKGVARRPVVVRACAQANEPPPQRASTAADVHGPPPPARQPFEAERAAVRSTKADRTTPMPPPTPYACRRSDKARITDEIRGPPRRRPLDDTSTSRNSVVCRVAVAVRPSNRLRDAIHPAERIAGVTKPDSARRRPASNTTANTDLA